MKEIKVKELMVPLAEYATVSRDATLYEAVVELEKAQTEFNEKQTGYSYSHRAILVLDAKGKIVGKLSQFAILRGLEPRYEHVGDLSQLSRFGWQPEFVKTIPQKFGLWEKPMDDLCKKAAKAKVVDVMDPVSEAEFIQEDASFDQAVHQLLMGRLQSLMVVKGEEPVGILRLSDVFKVVTDAIKQCEY